MGRTATRAEADVRQLRREQDVVDRVARQTEKTEARARGSVGGANTEHDGVFRSLAVRPVGLETADAARLIRADRSGTSSAG